MHIIIDKKACIGCGLCADICPDLIKLDGKLAVVKREPSTPLEQACCRDAADACPVDAIKVEEDGWVSRRGFESEVGRL